LTSCAGIEDRVDVSVAGDAERRRVFIPQALGADEFLRVTWHEQKQVIVFSHWQGDHCVAATPVRVTDIAELAELTVAALASTMPPGPAPTTEWPAPEADALVTTQLTLDLSA
jgi:hypothetical protein